MENCSDIVNVESLILCTNRKRSRKFIDYITMKHSDEYFNESGKNLRNSNISIFSFYNNNILDIKDTKKEKIYRINFSQDYADDKFYHCFIIIYDSSDQKDYDTTIETFFPLIKNLTSGLTFDFVLILIGDCNACEGQEREVKTKNSQDIAIKNNFFLLEINFSKKTNLDLINKVLRIRLAQSYTQYKEYYDDTNIKPSDLNMFRVFDFRNRNNLTQNNENISAGNIYVYTSNSGERQEIINLEDNLKDKNIVTNAIAITYVNTKDEKKNNGPFGDRNVSSDKIISKCRLNTPVNEINTLTVTLPKQSNYNSEFLEKHSFLKDLFSAKTKGNPTKLLNNTKENDDIKNNNARINKPNQCHHRTYSESLKITPRNPITPEQKSIYSNRNLILKCNPLLELNIISKDNIYDNKSSEEIANIINTKLSLNLEKQHIISLAKCLSRKINKFIKNLTQNKTHSNTISINLNKIVKFTKLKVVVTVNNRKLFFYIEHHKNNDKKNYIYTNDIIEEIINSLDKSFDYDITGLKSSLKKIIETSIKNSILETKHKIFN